MKCPVCDRENTSMLCPQCGFDSSKDYGRYPTFGAVGYVQSASTLRKERERKERPLEPIRVYWELKPEPKPEIPTAPEPEKTEPVRKSPDKPNNRVRKELEQEPWYMAPWFVLAKYMALMLMIIGMIVTVVDMVKPSQTENGEHEPMETAHVTQPPETTDSDQVVVVIAPQLTNVLRSDETPDEYDRYHGEYPVFGSAYQRGQIRSVTFLDTLADKPDDAWDVSEAGDGRVMAWVKPNGKLYDLYIGAEDGVWAGTSCVRMFDFYENTSEITFGDAFHTENVQDMSEMFRNCAALTTLDLSSFDTAAVQDMGGMFALCSDLNRLDLSSFNTANVRSMSGMFWSCGNLSSLDLSNFNTANVQSMSGMFLYCGNLTSLDLSSFDTSRVRDMEKMFAGCNSLERLNVSEAFVTADADTTDLFTDCPLSDDMQPLL